MMLSSLRLTRKVVTLSPTLRYFATSSSPTPPPAPSEGGAGFFQRISSFLVGAGVTALGTQYFIHQEIVEGNKIMLEKQKSIEKRLSALEKQR